MSKKKESKKKEAKKKESKDKSKVKDLVKAVTKIVPLLKDKHFIKIDRAVVNEKQTRAAKGNQNIVQQSTEQV